MTKLSEKDQEWLVGATSNALCVVFPFDVKNYLIQKDAEHKAEIDALEEVICHLSKSILGRDDDILSLKGQLAQHDKQVKIDVLERLVEQSTFRGLRNSIQPEELDEFINQIKEQ